MERMSNFYDGEETTTIYDRLYLYVYPIGSLFNLADVSIL